MPVVGWNQKSKQDVLRICLQRCFTDASTLGILMGDLNLSPDFVENAKMGAVGKVQDVAHHPVTGWRPRIASGARHHTVFTDYIIAGDSEVHPVELVTPLLGLDGDHEAVLARVVYRADRASTPVAPVVQAPGVTQQDVAEAQAVMSAQEARETPTPTASTVPQDAPLAQLVMQQQIDRRIVEGWQSSALTPAAQQQPQEQIERTWAQVAAQQQLPQQQQPQQGAVSCSASTPAQAEGLRPHQQQQQQPEQQLPPAAASSAAAPVAPLAQEVDEPEWVKRALQANPWAELENGEVHAWRQQQQQQPVEQDGDHIWQTLKGGSRNPALQQQQQQPQLQQQQHFLAAREDAKQALALAEQQKQAPALAEQQK